MGNVALSVPPGAGNPSGVRRAEVVPSTGRSRQDPLSSALHTGGGGGGGNAVASGDETRQDVGGNRRAVDDGVVFLNTELFDPVELQELAAGFTEKTSRPFRCRAESHFDSSFPAFLVEEGERLAGDELSLGTGTDAHEELSQDLMQQISTLAKQTKYGKFSSLLEKRKFVIRGIFAAISRKTSGIFLDKQDMARAEAESNLHPDASPMLLVQRVGLEYAVKIFLALLRSSYVKGLECPEGRGLQLLRELLGILNSLLGESPPLSMYGSTEFPPEAEKALQPVWGFLMEVLLSEATGKAPGASSIQAECKSQIVRILLAMACAKGSFQDMLSVISGLLQVESLKKERGPNAAAFWVDIEDQVNWFLQLSEDDLISNLKHMYPVTRPSVKIAAEATAAAPSHVTPTPPDLSATDLLDSRTLAAVSIPRREEIFLVPGGSALSPGACSPAAAAAALTASRVLREEAVYESDGTLDTDNSDDEYAADFSEAVYERDVSGDGYLAQLPSEDAYQAFRRAFGDDGDEEEAEEENDEEEDGESSDLHRSYLRQLRPVHRSALLSTLEREIARAAGEATLDNTSPRIIEALRIVQDSMLPAGRLREFERLVHLDTSRQVDEQSNPQRLETGDRLWERARIPSRVLQTSADREQFMEICDPSSADDASQGQTSSPYLEPSMYTRGDWPLSGYVEYARLGNSTPDEMEPFSRDPVSGAVTPNTAGLQEHLRRSQHRYRRLPTDPSEVPGPAPVSSVGGTPVDNTDEDDLANKSASRFRRGRSETREFRSSSINPPPDARSPSRTGSVAGVPNPARTKSKQQLFAADTVLSFYTRQNVDLKSLEPHVAATILLAHLIKLLDAIERYETSCVRKFGVSAAQNPILQAPFCLHVTPATIGRIVELLRSTAASVFTAEADARNRSQLLRQRSHPERYLRNLYVLMFSIKLLRAHIKQLSSTHMSPLFGIEASTARECRSLLFQLAEHTFRLPAPTSEGEIERAAKPDASTRASQGAEDSSLEGEVSERNGKGGSGIAHSDVAEGKTPPLGAAAGGRAAGISAGGEEGSPEVLEEGAAPTHRQPNFPQMSPSSLTSVSSESFFRSGIGLATHASCTSAHDTPHLQSEGSSTPEEGGALEDCGRLLSNRPAVGTDSGQSGTSSSERAEEPISSLHQMFLSHARKEAAESKRGGSHSHSNSEYSRGGIGRRRTESGGRRSRSRSIRSGQRDDMSGSVNSTGGASGANTINLVVSAAALDVLNIGFEVFYPTSSEQAGYLASLLERFVSDTVLGDGYGRLFRDASGRSGMERGAVLGLSSMEKQFLQLLLRRMCQFRSLVLLAAELKSPEIERLATSHEEGNALTEGQASKEAPGESHEDADTTHDGSEASRSFALPLALGFGLRSGVSFERNLPALGPVLIDAVSMLQNPRFVEPAPLKSSQEKSEQALVVAHPGFGSVEKEPDLRSNPVLNFMLSLVRCVLSAADSELDSFLKSKSATFVAWKHRRKDELPYTLGLLMMMQKLLLFRCGVMTGLLKPVPSGGKGAPETAGGSPRNTAAERSGAQESAPRLSVPSAGGPWQSKSSSRGGTREKNSTDSDSEAVFARRAIISYAGLLLDGATRLLRKCRAEIEESSDTRLEFIRSLCDDFISKSYIGVLVWPFLTALCAFQGENRFQMSLWLLPCLVEMIKEVDGLRRFSFRLKLPDTINRQIQVCESCHPYRREGSPGCDAEDDSNRENPEVQEFVYTFPQAERIVVRFDSQSSTRAGDSVAVYRGKGPDRVQICSVGGLRAGKDIADQAVTGDTVSVSWTAFAILKSNPKPPEVDAAQTENAAREVDSAPADSEPQASGLDNGGDAAPNDGISGPSPVLVSRVGSAKARKWFGFRMWLTAETPQKPLAWIHDFARTICWLAGDHCAARLQSTAESSSEIQHRDWIESQLFVFGMEDEAFFQYYHDGLPCSDNAKREPPRARCIGISPELLECGVEFPDLGVTAGLAPEMYDAEDAFLKDFVCEEVDESISRFVASLNRRSRMLHVPRSISSACDWVVRAVFAVMLRRTWKVVEVMSLVREGLDDGGSPSHDITRMWQKSLEMRSWMAMRLGQGYKPDETTRGVLEKCRYLLLIKPPLLDESDLEPDEGMGSYGDDTSGSLSLGPAGVGHSPSLDRSRSRGAKVSLSRTSSKRRRDTDRAAKAMSSLSSALKAMRRHSDLSMILKHMGSHTRKDPLVGLYRSVLDFCQSEVDLAELTKAFVAERCRAAIRLSGLAMFSELIRVTSERDLTMELIRHLGTSLKQKTESEKAQGEAESPASGEEEGERTGTIHFLSSLRCLGADLRHKLLTTYYDLLSSVDASKALLDEDVLLALNLYTIDYTPSDLEYLDRCGIVRFLEPLVAFDGTEDLDVRKLDLDADFGTGQEHMLRHRRGGRHLAVEEDGFPVLSRSASSRRRHIQDLQQLTCNVNTHQWNVRYGAWTLFRLLAYVCARIDIGAQVSQVDQDSGALSLDRQLSSSYGDSSTSTSLRVPSGTNLDPSMVLTLESSTRALELQDSVLRAILTQLQKLQYFREFRRAELIAKEERLAAEATAATSNASQASSTPANSSDKPTVGANSSNAQANQGPVDWSCKICTFLNPPTADRCQMCETVRDSEEVVSMISCPACTLLNVAGTARCSVCETPLEPPAGSTVSSHPGPSGSAGREAAAVSAAQPAAGAVVEDEVEGTNVFFDRILSHDISYSGSDPSEPTTARCECSDEEEWVSVRTSATFSSGALELSIRIDKDPNHARSDWRFVIGVASSSYDCRDPLQFCGMSQSPAATSGSVRVVQSWGYVAGNGNKLHRPDDPWTYGESFAQGDVIRVVVNFSDATLEFFKNGQSQGIAFGRIEGPLCVAVSMKGHGAQVSIVDRDAYVDEVRDWDRRLRETRVTESSVAWFKLDQEDLSNTGKRLKRSEPASIAEVDMYINQWLWVVSRVCQSGSVARALCSRPWVRSLLYGISDESGSLTRSLTLRICRHVLPLLSPRSPWFTDVTRLVGFRSRKAAASKQKESGPGRVDLVEWLLVSVGEQCFSFRDPECYSQKTGTAAKESKDDPPTGAQAVPEGSIDAHAYLSGSTVASEIVALIRVLLLTDDWRLRLTNILANTLQTLIQTLSELGLMAAESVRAKCSSLLPLNSRQRPPSVVSPDDRCLNIPSSIQRKIHMAIGSLCVLGGLSEPLREGSRVSFIREGREQEGVVTVFNVTPFELCILPDDSAESSLRASSKREAAEHEVEAISEVDLLPEVLEELPRLISSVMNLLPHLAACTFALRIEPRAHGEHDRVDESEGVGANDKELPDKRTRGGEEQSSGLSPLVAASHKGGSKPDEPKKESGGEKAAPFLHDFSKEGLAPAAVSSISNMSDMPQKSRVGLLALPITRVLLSQLQRRCCKAVLTALESQEVTRKGVADVSFMQLLAALSTQPCPSVSGPVRIENVVSKTLEYDILREQNRIRCMKLSAAADRSSFYSDWFKLAQNIDAMFEEDERTAAEALRKETLRLSQAEDQVDRSAVASTLADSAPEKGRGSVSIAESVSDALHKAPPVVARASLAEGGEIFAFGKGDNGRLGVGHSNSVSSPSPIPALDSVSVVDVSCFSAHVIALTQCGKVYSWGKGDDGRLGHGNPKSLLKPKVIETLQHLRVVQVSAGLSFSACLDDSGAVWTFGNNTNGQIGNGSFTYSYFPYRVESLADVHISRIGTGGSHILAVTSDHVLYSWGKNQYGQLGHGNTTKSNLPARVAASDDKQFVLVRGGWEHSMAVTVAGQLYTWGAGYEGTRPVCGHGVSGKELVPRKVETLADHVVIHIACGWDHSLAVTSTGKLYAWGAGTMGMLGNGSSSTYQSTPGLVGYALEGENVVWVDGGQDHSVAVTDKGDAWAFGSGGSHLGLPSTSCRKVPAKMSTLREKGVVSRVACGDKCTFAILTNEPPKLPTVVCDQREERKAPLPPYPLRAHLISVASSFFVDKESEEDRQGGNGPNLTNSDPSSKSTGAVSVTPVVRDLVEGNHAYFVKEMERRQVLSGAGTSDSGLDPMFTRELSEEELKENSLYISSDPIVLDLDPEVFAKSFTFTLGVQFEADATPCAEPNGPFLFTISPHSDWSSHSQGLRLGFDVDEAGYRTLMLTVGEDENLLPMVSLQEKKFNTITFVANLPEEWALDQTGDALLYINGKLHVLDDDRYSLRIPGLRGALTSSPMMLQVGGFQGRLRNVAFWDHALTDEHVRGINARGINYVALDFQSDLRAKKSFWSFDCEKCALNVSDDMSSSVALTKVLPPNVVSHGEVKWVTPPLAARGHRGLAGVFAPAPERSPHAHDSSSSAAFVEEHCPAGPVDDSEDSRAKFATSSEVQPSRRLDSPQPRTEEMGEDIYSGHGPEVANAEFATQRGSEETSAEVVPQRETNGADSNGRPREVSSANSGALNASVDPSQVPGPDQQGLANPEIPAFTTSAEPHQRNLSAGGLDAVSVSSSEQLDPPLNDPAESAVSEVADISALVVGESEAKEQHEDTDGDTDRRVKQSQLHSARNLARPESVVAGPSRSLLPLRQMKRRRSEHETPMLFPSRRRYRCDRDESRMRRPSWREGDSEVDEYPHLFVYPGSSIVIGNPFHSVESRLSQYSMLFDILITSLPPAKDWLALYQTKTDEVAEAYIRGDGMVGVFGCFGNGASDESNISSSGGGGAVSADEFGVKPNKWHRIVTTVNCVTKTQLFYIDGHLVSTNSRSRLGRSDRFSLLHKFALFSDSTPGNCLGGRLKLFQMFNYCLPSSSVAALGGVKNPPVAHRALSHTAVSLRRMGFPSAWCEKALLACNMNRRLACYYILENRERLAKEDLLAKKKEDAESLSWMGYPLEWCMEALVVNKSDYKAAIIWLFENEAMLRRTHGPSAKSETESRALREARMSAAVRSSPVEVDIDNLVSNPAYRILSETTEEMYTRLGALDIRTTATGSGSGGSAAPGRKPAREIWHPEIGSACAPELYKAIFDEDIVLVTLYARQAVLSILENAQQVDEGQTQDVLKYLTSFGSIGFLAKFLRLLRFSHTGSGMELLHDRLMEILSLEASVCYPPTGSTKRQQRTISFEEFSRKAPISHFLVTECLLHLIGMSVVGAKKIGSESDALSEPSAQMSLWIIQLFADFNSEKVEGADSLSESVAAQGLTPILSPFAGPSTPSAMPTMFSLSRPSIPASIPQDERSEKAAPVTSLLSPSSVGSKDHATPRKSSRSDIKQHVSARMFVKHLLCPQVINMVFEMVIVTPGDTRIAYLRMLSYLVRTGLEFDRSKVEVLRKHLFFLYRKQESSGLFSAFFQSLLELILSMEELSSDDVGSGTHAPAWFKSLIEAKQVMNVLLSNETLRSQKTSVRNALLRAAPLPSSFIQSVSATMGFKVTSSRSEREVAGELRVESFEKVNRLFSLETDEQFVAYINARCLADETDPLSVFPTTFYAITSLEHAKGSSYDLLKGIPIIALKLRFALLQKFNKMMVQLLPLVDLGRSAQESYLAESVRRVRGLLFHSVKMKLWERVLENTAGGSGHGDVKIDEFKASRLRERNKVDQNGTKCVFGQLFSQLNKVPPANLRQRRDERSWKVVTLGQYADDYGGPYRNCLVALCLELHAPVLSLFLPCPNRRTKNGLNQDKFVPRVSSTRPIQISMFEFLGKLMGIAIRSGNFLELQLPSIVWKHLVGQPKTKDDVLAIDVVAFQAVKNIRELESDRSIGPEMYEDVLCMNFTTSRSDAEEVELVVNGEETPVTGDNCEQFIELLVHFRTNEFNIQSEAMKRGLATIVPYPLLSLFTWEELERMVCGNPHFDVALLKSMTVYDGCSPEDPHIKNFWAVMNNRFEDRERSMFLRFVWGRSRLPTTRQHFDSKMKISAFVRGHKNMDAYLPVSHTCFFQIDLPAYSSVDVMEQRLLYAITHCVAIDADSTSNAQSGARALTSFDDSDDEDEEKKED